ncbi:MAG: MbcA/ParS/Xre antitoxin family protein [Hyphomicrobiales bacterium]|nr:MbcA/ParS/Xre antitoxin family protein [Hyphomicrobiales bacterium]
MAQGAVARYLDELQTEGGLKGTDIANVTEVSKATVSRWKSGAVKPHPRNELILSDLYYVVGRLNEYYAADEIRSWLYARHPQLGGERAIDLINQDRTIEVLKVLDRLDSDAFV